MFFRILIWTFRIIFFSLRAAVSTSSDADTSGANDYMQTTLSLGVAVIFNDLVGLLRCLLISSTFPTLEDNSCLTLQDRERISRESGAGGGEWALESREKWEGSMSPTISSESKDDQPLKRKSYRTMATLMQIVFGLTQLFSAWGNSALGSSIDNPAKNKVNQALR